MLPPVTGMIAATLTPFGEDGRIRLAALREHVEFLVLGGLPAVAPAGTTGEFLYLSEEERAAVVRATVQAAAGRLRVIAGIWSESPEGVARLARAAEKSGAHAVFLTTPVYYPAGDEVLLRWYRAAREATALPLLAYHIPQYAANGISVDLFRRLLDDGTVQGIKDSTGKPERLRELLQTARGRAPVYAASDSFIVQARELGADGFISALANIFPRTALRAWEGDRAAQAALDRVRTLTKEYGGIGALKALLSIRGLYFDGARIPFSDLTETRRADLLAAVAELGDLD